MNLSSFYELVNQANSEQEGRLLCNGFSKVSPYIFSKDMPSKSGKKMISLINEIFKQLIKLLVDVVECVEVRSSTIHGANNGIFAIHHLDKNSVVSIYSPDVTILDEHGIVRNESLIDRVLAFKDKVGRGDAIFEEYIYSLSPSDSCINPPKILSLPESREHFSVAHMANDSFPNTAAIRAIPNNCESTTIMMFCDLYKSYIDYAFENANVVIAEYNGVVYLRTTKSINPDDEIFTTYGFKYWISPEMENETYCHLEALTFGRLLAEDPSFLDKFNFVMDKQYQIN
jgi:hypothetical protein